MQLALVLEWQVPVCQDVLGRILEEGGGLRKPRSQALGHLPQLRPRRRVIGLREDRAHHRRNGFAGALRHRRQQVPHEVHATPLPRRAAQDRSDRLFQAFMRIRGDETHAAEAALHQAAEKGRPEGPILRRPHVDAEHLALALADDADGHDGRLAGHPAIDPDFVVRRIHPPARVVGRSARVRNASTSGSSSAQIRETSDFDTPSSPSAFISSSTFRVETPCTYASWMTASTAYSARRRG